MFSFLKRKKATKQPLSVPLSLHPKGMALASGEAFTGHIFSVEPVVRVGLHPLTLWDDRMVCVRVIFMVDGKEDAAMFHAAEYIVGPTSKFYADGVRNCIRLTSTDTVDWCIPSDSQWGWFVRLLLQRVPMTRVSFAGLEKNLREGRLTGLQGSAVSRARYVYEAPTGHRFKIALPVGAPTTDDVLDGE